MTNKTSTGVNMDDQHTIQHDADYAAFLAEIKANFEKAAQGTDALFTVGKRKTLHLFDTFLNELPADRQVHDCQTCRHFFAHYGHLVLIDNMGRTRSALWSNYKGPAFYADAVRALQERVEDESVTGVFVENERVLGTPKTVVESGYTHYAGSTKHPAGTVFTHLSVELPAKHRYSAPVLTKGQRAAELREDFRTLAAAVSYFMPQVANDALTLLKSGSLYQGQQFVAPMEWFRNILDEQAHYKGEARRNALWHAVATAPVGFAKPKGRPYGKLMDMLTSGMPLAQIKKEFATMLDPTKFRRPQKAASNSNLQQAEKVVAALNAAPAFARRYARPDEIPARGTLWEPGQSVENTQSVGSSDGSLFGHLRKGPAQRAPLRTETFGQVQIITLEKFVRTVLPGAESVQIKLARYSVLGALVTAVDADAPPILSYDEIGKRNPVSYYTYAKPRALTEWSLDAANWHAVTKISTLPTQWNGVPNNLAKGALFVIEGAKDTSKDVGLALFPQFLKSEFTPVRRSIEEFSSKGKLEGRDDAYAAGFLILSDVGGVADNVIRVISDRGRQMADYKIDRLD